MVDKMDTEFREVLKNNLLQERERNLEYVSILKDYIQHLKSGLRVYIKRLYTALKILSMCLY